jgi:hypothetical protein
VFDNISPPPKNSSFLSQNFFLSFGLYYMAVVPNLFYIGQLFGDNSLGGQIFEVKTQWQAKKDPTEGYFVKKT